MAKEPGFFDVDARLRDLSAKGDDLVRVNALVDFEAFRSELEQAVPRADRSKGGRPPYDHVLMFRILILQACHSLSDERTEYLIKDRLSFMRFLGLSLADRVPDANSIWNFREALTRAQIDGAPAIEAMFRRFEAQLSAAGYIAMGGQIVDATVVAAPKQRNTEDVYSREGDDRVRIAVKSAPRGNGKTGLCAGLALCHLLGPEAEPRGEIYSAAVDRQQAGLLFNEIEATIDAVPEFAARVNIIRYYKKIEVTDGVGLGSVYEALSADARRAHGLAPSFWVYDELAQAKDRTLLDNLRTAMGKRKAALGMVISTQAADNDHPLSLLIDDGLASEDPAVVVHLLAAPLDADPFDLETIRAVNPALGVFLDEGDLVREAELARRLPAFRPAFENLRLNRRIDADADLRIVTREVWELGAVPVDIEPLRGRPCYGALDLSGKHDLTSLTLVFPSDDPEPVFDILPLFWTPSEATERRNPRERELFGQWIRGGFITAIDGPTIRYSAVAAELARLKELYDIRAVAYDRWRIADLQADMADIGLELPLEEFGQGFKDQSPAVEVFVDLALTGRLRHGGNPVLTSCIANAITVTDPAGNVKVDKGKSNRAGMTRIDGAVTLIMALAIAKRFEAEPVLDVAAMIA